jgi:hypothetical protein
MLPGLHHLKQILPVHHSVACQGKRLQRGGRFASRETLWSRLARHATLNMESLGSPCDWPKA